MTKRADKIDLDRLGLKPGGGWHGDVLVAPLPFIFGEQRYEPTQDAVAVRVSVSRTTTGFVIKVAFQAAVEGPCMRCFDRRGFAVEIEQPEVHEPQIDLESEYVGDDVLDLSAMVHDLVGLALPATMSGELDPLGGCRLCGRDEDELRQLGIGDASEADQGDPRWAKLRELEL